MRIKMEYAAATADMSSKGNEVVDSSVNRNGICLRKGLREYSVKCDSKWGMSSKGNGVVDSSAYRNGICCCYC